MINAYLKKFSGVKPNKTYIEENHTCRKTQMPGVCDSFDFDGNTIWVGSDDNDYKVISGLQFIIFSTEHILIDLISFLRNNMIPAVITVEDKCTFFISDSYNFLKTKELSKEVY